MMFGRKLVAMSKNCTENRRLDRVPLVESRSARKSLARSRLLFRAIPGNAVRHGAAAC